MRDAACRGWIEIADRPEFVFLTGDLGFKALEPLRARAGRRFINAGVAEQNMVSVAAALAHEALRPWVYSIAPFCYARPFEQIRNDVCLHGLPVQFVGNGGGYAYGPMGATHHALEDYGVLSTLSGLRAYVPAFDEDVGPVIAAMSVSPFPGYLRLGVTEKPKDESAPPFAPWRRLTKGDGPVLIGVGPLVGCVWDEIRALPERQRPELWAVGVLPLERAPPPEEFRRIFAEAPRAVVVFEEHVAQGGFAQMFAAWALGCGLPVASFRALSAQGYVSGTYGSQAFHRRESGIDARSVLDAALGRPNRRAS